MDLYLISTQIDTFYILSNSIDEAIKIAKKHLTDSYPVADENANYMQIRECKRFLENVLSTVNRDNFMEFFRDDDKLNTLSIDDRIEIWKTVMPYMTNQLIEELREDYCVS